MKPQSWATKRLNHRSIGPGIRGYKYNYPNSIWTERLSDLRKNPETQRLLVVAIRRFNHQYFQLTMLHRLTVSNIVLIEQLTLQFEPGLTVLTGETNLGKSPYSMRWGWHLGAVPILALFGKVMIKQMSAPALLCLPIIQHGTSLKMLGSCPKMK